MGGEKLEQAAAGDVGRRLREFRTERGLSLAEVAKATGISTSFLSLVETGQSDITFGRLSRLINFYGLEFGDLALASRRNPVVLRAGEETHAVSLGEGIDVFFLACKPHAPITPVIAIYEPGGETSEPIQVAGDEFVYVLEGTLELTIQGERPIVLRAGDSAYVSSKSARAHTYRNAARRRTRALFAVSPKR
ncbi:MAG TPA: XRE family transcriptional regulator [Gaiellaceae bacterium]|nr:XRE family transcriptional regulator [Gaiellaceae bacterium]